MNLVIPLQHEQLRLKDCERKVAAFFALDDLYVNYDAKARPDRPNEITKEELNDVNRAMQTRSPERVWEELLCKPLPKLEAIGTSADLVAMSDKQWDAVKPALSSLYQCVMSKSGINAAVGTKVLHLKRPRLVAIADRLIMDWLKIPGGKAAERALGVAVEIRRIGRTCDNQAVLADIRAYLGRLSFILPGRIPGACRILDALLWMEAREKRSKRYVHLWEVVGLAIR
jgi:hypothetical protein